MLLQGRNQNGAVWFAKWLVAVGLLITTITTAVIFTPLVWAQDEGGLIMGADGNAIGSAMDPMSVPTSDEEQHKGTEKQTLKDKFWELWDRKYDIGKELLKTTASVGYRKGVRYFLQKLAQDTALWIAKGGRGSQPLFITQGWGAYLGEAADGAVGLMLDELTQKGGYLSFFNVCDPNLDLQLRINLGLQGQRLDRPHCKFSLLRANWEQAINKADFLPDFQRTFNKGENDLGIAFTALSGAIELKGQAKQDAEKLRLEGSGFLPLVDQIAGDIQLPSVSVKNIIDSTFLTSISSELFPTNDIIADSISTFTNTLAATFLDRLFKEGFGSSSSRRRQATAVLQNPEAALGNEPVQAAKLRLAQEIAPSFATPGRYDALAQLVACPKPANPGPTECVITDNMRTAITQQLTVRQAIDKGLFNGDAAFGFTSWEPQPIEPSYSEGIPYRTILILRKYRIVPVGWELAARYVQHFGHKRVTLRELIYAYKDETSPFYHFVDPEWLLTAPEAFCKLQGPGPEIISTDVSGGSDSNGDGDFNDPGDTLPQVQISRDDKYCADEQTCIKKDNNGICQFYGYCTEEKRVWNFGSNSCNPRFNSCQTFEDQQNGTTVSYLLNTVDFDSCDEKSVGCKKYSRVRNMTVAADAANAWSEAENDSVYLNSKTADCESSDAGCRAYIRTGLLFPASKPAVHGVNLLQNPSFEATSGTPPSPTGWIIDDPTKTFLVSDAFDGNQSVKLLWTGTAGIHQQIDIGIPTGGLNFTLSFYAKGSAIPPNTTPQVSYHLAYELPGGIFTVAPLIEGELKSDVTDEWQHFSATLTVPTPTSTTRLKVEIWPEPASSIIIDAIKLEATPAVTAYTPYGSASSGVNTVHLKRAPDYLGCRVTPNATGCEAYARFCSVSEVGCLSYSAKNGGAPITSVRGDECPAECVGYDVYTQSATAFENLKIDVDLIPSTARRCTAAAVGCDEFTNLDIESQGGEARTYYQSLRLCQKPGATDEGTFYTWEGSDTRGFQLKVYKLKKTHALPADNPLLIPPAPETWAPCVSLNWLDASTVECKDDVQARLNAGLCSEGDYRSNPDCRQFYDEIGQVSYRLLSRTVSISSECTPYRQTQSTQTDCTDHSGYWNSEINACLYQVVPREGRRCSASAAGCREYRGGTAGNYRVVTNDTFEGGIGRWQGGRLSPVASAVGGHSYEFAADADGESITQDLSVTRGSIQEGDITIDAVYTLSFWARRQNTTTPPGVTISAGVQGTAKTFFATPQVLSNDDGKWQLYQSDPLVLLDTGTTSGTVTIEITAAGTADEPIYIDNIILKSNSNTHYLIKGSSTIPASCQPPAAADQLLGCQTFKVSDGPSRNIWRFGPSCPAEAVGCEALIDTQNSTLGAEAPFAKTYAGTCSHDRNVQCTSDSFCDNIQHGSLCSEYTVSDDTVDYLVNDSAKRCNGAKQGCEALGLQSLQAGSEAIDMIVAVDRSGSIGALNMATVISAVQGFIGAALPQDTNIGLVSFGDPAILDATLRHDAASLNVIVGDYDSGGNTDTAGALGKARSEFTSSRARPSAKKIIVVVTDGEPATALGADQDVANTRFEAKAAKDRGSTIYVLGVGGALGSPLTGDPAITREVFLRNEIASSPTHYFAVASFGELSAALISLQNQLGQGQSKWSTVTLLNNPDRYDDILCRFEQRDCSAFIGKDKNKPYYFKDPGDKVCEYRSGVPQPGWYKKGTAALEPSPNCSSTAVTRTLVGGGQTEPTTGWAGLCPAGESSCTEFIDARSDDQRNLLFNGNFIVDDDSNGEPDRWIKAGFIEYSRDNRKGVRVPATTADLSQVDIILNGRTLYTVSAEVVNQDTPSTAAIAIRDCEDTRAPANPVPVTSPTGTMVTPLNNAVKAATFYTPSINYAALGAGDAYERLSGQFYINGGSVYRCDIAVGPADYLVPAGVLPASVAWKTGANGNWFRNVSLRPTSMYYQQADRVDKASCRGLVNGNDCVLVNQRTVSPARSVSFGQLHYQSLGADTDTSPTDSGTPNTIIDTSSPEFGTCVKVGAATIGDCTNLVGRRCQNDSDCALPFDVDSAPIKVKPDRQCAAWLSCQTARTITKGGATKTVCLDVQSCDDLDSKGQCTNQVLGDKPDNLTFSRGDVDLLRNRSGYSKVGFDWGGMCTAGKIGTLCVANPDCDTVLGDGSGRCGPRIIQGYMSPAFMPQVGESLPIVNGDFESAAVSGNPVGWLGWQDGVNFRVINSPIAAQKVGISYPREGRNFLEVNAKHILPVARHCSNDVTKSCTIATDCDPVPPPTCNTDSPVQPIANVSNFIPVTDNTEYVISVYLNTLRFTGKSAEVRVYEYDEDRNLVNVPREQPDGTSVIGPYYAALNLGPGFDWSLMINRFSSSAGTAFIRLQFAWDPEDALSSGLWYIDDLKIQPALKYQKNQFFNNADRPRSHVPPDFPLLPDERGLEDLDSHHAPQSCRLYPETGALSCSYFDDNGLRHRGKLGYCLEWDPRNSNYCLQWWPVDSVIGEDTGEDMAGYSDRVPLYMCTEIQTRLNIIGTDIDAPQTDDNDAYPHETWFDGDIASGLSLNTVGRCKAAPTTVCQKNDDCISPDTCQLFPPSLAVCIGNGGESNILPKDKPFCTPPEGRFSWCGIGHWACVNARSALAADEAVDTNPDWNPDETFDPDRFEYWSLAKEFKRDQRGGHEIEFLDDSGRKFNFIAVVNKATKTVDHVTFFVHSWRTAPCDFFSGCESNNAPAFDVALVTAHGEACSNVMQVVSPTGENAAWSSRIAKSSSYVTEPLGYNYYADYTPFGGAVVPAPIDDPAQWDSKTKEGQQPLYYERPLKGATDPNTAVPIVEPYQVRAGQPYSCAPPFNAPLYDAACVGENGRVIGSPYPTCDFESPEDINGLCRPGKCDNDATRTCENDSGCANGGSCDLSYPCQDDNQCIGERAGRTPQFTGQTYDQAKQVLSQLFMESYGAWSWGAQCVGGSENGRLCSLNTECPGGECVGLRQYSYDASLANIATPTNQCSKNVRLEKGSTCAVAPQIPNLEINRQATGKISVNRTGSVNFSFTAIADPDQEPITQYIIDWGDGTRTKQTALRLQSRPSQRNAIALTHTYNYSDARRCWNENPGGCRSRTPGLDCNAATSCDIEPRVQITDNWGWCNGDYALQAGCTPAEIAANPLACRRGYVGVDCKPSLTTPWRSSGVTVRINER